MIPLFLAQIKTSDGVILAGAVTEPRRTSDTALVWIHGLGSNFSHGQALVKELSARCIKNHIAYLKFNTRGHDVVNRDASKEKGLQGAAFEKFEECVLDIRAMIAHARKLGYRKIILAGHSTGANKILYYIYKTQDRRIKGIILAGAISDIVAGRKEFGAARHARGVTFAKKLSRTDPNALMPRSYGIFSVRRFLSLSAPGRAEDTFPYHNPHASWKELQSIRQPLTVIIGERDECLDRSAQDFLAAFRQNARWTKTFSGVIIKGADHNFHKKEKELTDEIIRFIRRGVV